MKLNGRVALITGGARLGRTVALELARAGCGVALTYRTSKDSAEKTVKQIRDGGGKSIAVPVDVTKQNELKALVHDVARRLGGLSVLVNMASWYEKISLKTLQKKDEGIKAFDKNIAVDLRSAYTLALMCSPFMKKHGEGRIVNVCDWVVASGRPRYHGFLPYYTAKAGLKGLTEALALELAPHVLVNAVAPGPILPPKGLTSQQNKEVLQNTPLGRWGGPEEIAKAVLFFIESDFITGETLRVDGGRHLF